jgi:transglutaminase/protease-like cytokinesis protein 3
MTNEQKIKTIHDYIINNTMYDVDKNETGESPYDSITAYGTLIDHYAVCGGYSDSMAIFLNKFGIDNYKVSSDSHVWNALYFNDKWIHLDLTWDDPVSKNREQYLLYNYYLITTQELEKLSTVEHYYDKSIYQEIR